MQPEGALDELLTAAGAGEPVDPGPLVRSLDAGGREALGEEARHALEAIPVPIGPQVDGPAARQHRLLARVLAWIDAVDGQPDDLLELARRDWLDGGRHVPYLRLLMQVGRTSLALGTARALLNRPDCADREELESLIEEAASPPAGWDDAVVAFAMEPEPAAWDELLRFVPAELYAERVRYTLALLQKLDVDPEALFRCATHTAVVPEAFELVETGKVRPEVIRERAEQSTPEGRPLWLGLAARAACIRGDRFMTVRLLTDAVKAAGPDHPPDLDIRFVREHADEELHRLLDRAGLPRPEDP